MLHRKSRLASMLVFSLGLLSLGGCDDDSDGDSEPALTYDVQIQRTEYGIPHILAEDWGSLGYGYGYAYAEDNYCVLMRQIMFATGRSAEYLGEAGDLDSDFVFRWINGDPEQLSDWLTAQGADIQALVAGYAAGFNRYLSDTGVQHLSGGDTGCRDASWVRNIDALDLVAHYRKLLLRGGLDNEVIRQGIIAVTGPNTAAAASTTTHTSTGEQFAGLIDPGQNGSNALALGANYTRSGTGMLLGNPHQPWSGDRRWHQVHLTIPGEYDVMGATLQGLPMLGVGFNQDLAWTHTISFSGHMNLYELPLNPNDPMQYLYDGSYREISAHEVTAWRLEADGSLSEHRSTIYQSHYGPILNLASQSPLLDGWPMFNGSILTLNDANLSNTRALAQWISLGQAHTVAGLAEALKQVGLPWVNTIAADRHGDTFYGDISVIPYLTTEQLNDCNNSLITQVFTSLTKGMIIALDGSTSACAPGSSSDAPEGSSIFGFSELPSLSNRSYVINTNNSHWLTNLSTPLTGFPGIIGVLGAENQQQLLRGNLGHQMVSARMDASDGLDDSPGFTLDNLQAMMYTNRVLGAEITLDDLQTICTDAAVDSVSEDVLQACAILGDWDRKVDIDSRGAHLFTEFWRALVPATGLTGAYFLDDPTFWLTPFDMTQPTTTPSGIDVSLPANAERVLTALQGAIDALQAVGVALDSTLGEVQFTERGGNIIPLHGGWDEMGSFSVIETELEDVGYGDIIGGNGYIQTVTWDNTACPIAQGLTAHSQSIDPDSPHFYDQTQAYSEKRWLNLPYCEDDIERDSIAPVRQLQGSSDALGRS